MASVGMVELVSLSLLAKSWTGIGECLRKIRSNVPAAFSRCKTSPDPILTELMKKERDAWCQIASFISLISELECPWAWCSFSLPRGVLLDLSVSGHDCLFMSTFTQGLHFPFSGTKSAKADTQNPPARAVTGCQPCTQARTWP